MVLMTMIARVVDGLPLAASIQEDERSGKGVMDFQNQAKMLFKKLTPQSPPRCSIESELEGKAHGLSMMSQKYKKDARYLNLSSTYAKVAAVGVVLFVLFLYFYVF
ncbi:unnamed protein product [Notodromas monacha]|uniref:Longin domain-containing protein n=1 Tax=Notodromas monacha TaxID=399045 RepID=A0A7R9BWJ1_9CRUS|nr:unnamed protein product [Notodromas monacha]CAG0921704.1 unnamed protein product [Notodromas monacha]